jgi:hypothetical protein
MNRKRQHSIGTINILSRLEDYETLRPIIDEFGLDKTCKIINLGCGNSEFCEAMYDDGYKNIHNIDICDNVIDFMKERNLSRKDMICKLF